MLISRILALFTFLLGMVTAIDMSGHLKPIGHQRPIIKGEIPILHYLPDGKYFYDNFFYPAKPALFRGVLNKTKSMKRWTNTTYMHENFGDVWGVVDRRKSWKDGGKEVVPKSSMSYSEFLNSYEDLDLYWDYEIPRNSSILKDMPMPLSLHCWTTRNTFSYVNLMVNSGNVSYVFHVDNADNFFHFLSGRKRWLLADSKFVDHAYIGQETQVKSLSPINPDSVDLEKFPKMAEIPFHEVDLIPGDILYVPRNWPHYVQSKQGSNVAMNIWFGGDYNLPLPEVVNCTTQQKTLFQILK